MQTKTSMTTDRLGRIVEESASEVYLFAVDDFKFSLVNRGARENLGYTMEELSSRTPWDIKPFIDRNAFVQMVAPLISGEQRVLDFETVHERKDGSRYDVAVRLQLIGTEGERVFHAAIRDITERNRTERALRETSARLDAILDNTTMAIFLMDDRQHCIFMNRAAETLTGYTLEETQGRSLHDVVHHTYPDGRPFPIEECAIDRAFPENNQTQGEEVFVHKDGSFYPVGFTASPMKDNTGRVVGTVIEVRDISEELEARKSLESFNEALQSKVAEAMAEREAIEAQLVQAQKMEAVGHLTGGIAHDFNNLLQVIAGNLQLLQKELPEGAKAQLRVQNALAGVARGARLAAQLLAFGRQQALEPKPINIGRLVRGMDDMLRRTLGEMIEIETVISGGLWNCLADPAQVENAILNLAINARDAMNAEGKLTLEAGNASLDDVYASGHTDVSAGQYVMLAVTDTGSGISPELIERVFDPFFTTKETGEGTGLGLSMVYGFVKQSGGHIKIYSEPGQGTTVRIYLPRTREEEEVERARQSRMVEGQGETILVVEDDEAVRAAVVDLLGDLGYSVLKADSADSAMAILDSGLKIDLLFTDVVMPGKLRSPDLARKAKERQPNLAVLFTSGYTQNAIVHAGRLDDGVELISKPYTRERLAQKVREVLDARVPATVPAGPAPVDEDPSTPRKDTGRSCRGRRILLVEDEVLVRMATADMLGDMGHEVIDVGTLAEAKEVLARERIELLFTDLGLPDGSGDDLLHFAVDTYPGISIIVASGSAPDTYDGLKSKAQIVSLGKPYGPAALEAALRKCASAPENG